MRMQRVQESDNPRFMRMHTIHKDQQQGPRADGAGHGGTRYGIIDALRGFAIVNMVAFHICYDIFEIMGQYPRWSSLSWVIVWQQCIAGCFIAVSGFSWTWGSRHALRRGLELNALGLLITAVTLIMLPESPVWFGVLNFLGCATLLLLAMEPMVKRIPPSVGVFASLVLFFIFRRVQYGELWLGATTIKLPTSWYQYPLLTPFGFQHAGFISSDYVPILPWIFLFICGYCLSRWVIGRSLSQRKALVPQIPVLSAIGRHSLLIYMVHQPLCMGLVWIVFALFHV
ncbi:putative membrane protein [Bifidobacterium tsurumiense]|uniref:Putative membrane protein n=2 Tax=Bifidobacterium tsurumiense TaxID=356829 RepID=A0A087ECB3_9BIFI|nr:heparan-alpha-glucosaminide N-acetyltransferase [Bifidobacterium tsurumiense]KFJ05414.1 putative membrane protein [Bifidobacterium tsurumiense]MDY4677506.1 heparan-alpha-glucosaminide N-acetyltransferase [Bifidobacterium tsurumiense]